MMLNTEESELFFEEEKYYFFSKLFEELYSKYNKEIKIVLELFIFVVLIFSLYKKKESPSFFRKVQERMSMKEKENKKSEEKENQKTEERVKDNKEKSYEEKTGKGESKTKIALCVIAKEENRYIREFVEFYKKMKVDKIFLYDNNEVEGERFEDVISDYINSGFVNITNFRGFERPQFKSYRDCYQKNNASYDWLIYYDVDEFIYLKDFKDIKSFVDDKRFKNCERIQLNWVFYTDNNLLFYDNRSVLERFTEKEPNARHGKFGGSQEIKSMVRGHNPNLNLKCIHVIDKKLKSCDGFGRSKKVFNVRTFQSDYEYYYLRHFYSKSTEEFIEKIMKSDVVYALSKVIQMNKIKKYFTYSKITNEKLDHIEKKTGLNLSSYRSRVRNKFLKKKL